MVHARESDDDILSRREDIESPPDPQEYTSLRRLATAQDYRLMISFGGGATAGLCGNIALARLLEELDLRRHVSELWGTSAGAIVGAGWSTGTPAREMLTLLRGLTARNTIDVCHGELLLSVVLRPFGRALPDGLVYARRFATVIDAGLRAKRFEDCRIPFRCIACSDDGLNRRKVFRKGPMLPAILSSMSLPGIVIPRSRLQDEECGYYDGGLVEKTPLSSPIAEHLRSGDPRKLLLIATHFGSDAWKEPARGFINRFIQSIYAMEDALWTYQLEEARRKHAGRVNLLLLNPHLLEVGVFDFSRVLEHYLCARETFKQRLQDGSLALTFGND